MKDWDTEAKEAAEKYQSDWHHHRFAYSKDYTPESAFLAGAFFGRSQMEKELDAKKDEIDHLKIQLHAATYDRSKVSVHGTDGCMNCDTGRITIYAGSRYCIECQRKKL